MHKRIIEPLQTEFRHIKLRSSELNSYFYEWYTQNNPLSSAEICLAWDIIHSIIQHSMLWIDVNVSYYESVVNSLRPWTREKELWWLLDNIETYKNQWIERWKKYWTDVMEIKYTVFIEYWQFLIEFSWTYDLWNTRAWHLFDIKSSWSKRKDDKRDEQRQQDYYTFLKWIATNNYDDSDFTYLIATKQKKPQFQELTRTLTFENAQKRLKNDIESFISWQYMRDFWYEWDVEEIQWLNFWG